MGLLKYGLLVLVPLTLGYWLLSLPSGKLPDIEDGWWAAAEKEDNLLTSAVEPFNIKVSDDLINDLKSRLQGTRYFENLPGTNFDYGFNSNYLKEVVDYWKDKYDWKAQEAKLNAYPHFTTLIEGIKIHFIHVKPKSNNKAKLARPLMLIHGWPGSFYEFYKIIPLLTDPNNGVTFELIIPSIPGYGFSEQPHRTGFDLVATARIFNKLMKRLGHEKFYVQGGDWGSGVCKVMSLLYEKDIRGMHINFVSPSNFDLSLMLRQFMGTVFPSLVFSPEEQEAGMSFTDAIVRVIRETGYFHLQATRPDSLAVGLTDSPAGLAAYILEKFSIWSNQENRFCPDGCLTKHFAMDELLTNVMIYWVTGNIASSVRYYKEYSRNENISILAKLPVKVATGVAAFPKEVIMYYQAESFVRVQYPNLVHYTRMPRGGHFAAMEEPQLLADDVISFVKVVETL